MSLLFCQINGKYCAGRTVLLDSSQIFHILRHNTCTRVLFNACVTYSTVEYMSSILFYQNLNAGRQRWKRQRIVCNAFVKFEILSDIKIKRFLKYVAQNTYRHTQTMSQCCAFLND